MPLPAPPAALKLRRLAWDRFGSLTEAEWELFQAVVSGDSLDLTLPSEEETAPAGAETSAPEEKAPAGSQEVAPAESVEEREKDERPVVRAALVAWLCTDPQACVAVTGSGIQVTGGRFEGTLDLRSADVPFPLVFQACTFTTAIDLEGARVPWLVLSGSRTGAVDARYLKTEGPVHLNSDFRALGTVGLQGAVIGGNLVCDGGDFAKPEGNALNADGMKVGGSVFSWDRFKAEGEVRLPGAEIGGGLYVGAVSSLAGGPMPSAPTGRGANALVLVECSDLAQVDGDAD